ncbi:hypothetical protein [Actinomadura sp. 6N118]|uniref:hypothetical protein n=1 Tax=Actinomadura sp. 6N118 TaxID=3375151 RepID=UPI0037BDA671
MPPSTVRDILKRVGLDPALRRNSPTWAQFLKAQAEGIIACDLFHVATVLFKRVYVFFIAHATRVVHVAGVTTNPTGAWVAQQARNLGERGEQVRFRRECTDRLLIYNERHLRRVLTAYEGHHNTHRPHRARDRRPPQPSLRSAPADLRHVQLKRRRAVDGMISEYRNAA